MKSPCRVVCVGVDPVVWTLQMDVNVDVVRPLVEREVLAERRGEVGVVSSGRCRGQQQGCVVGSVENYGLLLTLDVLACVALGAEPVGKPQAEV